MQTRNCNKILCLASVILGLILIGLGVFLLTSGFPIDAITIGVIVAGILLLVLGCFGKCFKFLCIFCVLLTLVTLFLIISGILALLIGFLVIGLILISLGILTLILAAICFVLKLCDCKDGRDKRDTITLT